MPSWASPFDQRMAEGLTNDCLRVVMTLSGGRMKIGPEGSDDNLLWIDWQGAKWPAAAPQW